MIDELSQIARANHFLINESRQLPFKRYFYASLRHQTPLCLILKGQRGVGKSTAIYQYIAERNDEGMKTFYLPADAVTIRDMPLIDIVEHLVSSGTQVLAIDEMQKRKNFADELKSIRDFYPKLELIVSVSSAMELDSADLSRRAFKVECVGLSFREYLNLTYAISLRAFKLDEILKSHSDISACLTEITQASKINILEEFQKYLHTGYFPTSIHINNRDIFFKTLRQAIDRTIESDLMTSYPSLNGTSISKIKRLLSFISKSGPFVPDYAKLKAALEITSETTIKEYFFYLHKADIIRLLPKNKESIGILRKPEKIYFDNPNYLVAVAPAEASNIGTLRETFVFMAIDNFMNLQDAPHGIFAAAKGDFATVNGEIFEVGGRNKGFKQIAGVPNSYVLSDDLLHGSGRQLPMWLLGFLW
jgi:predicted AAA+ superfamily ATPase